VAADLGDVGDHNDGAAGEHFGARELITIFPDAFFEDGIKHGRLAHELALHFQSAEAFLDFEDPTALVHFATDGHYILHKALAHEVNAVEIAGDFGIGEKHLHASGGGGIWQRGKGLTAFFDWEGDELFDYLIAEFHLLGPIGAAGGVVWR